MALLVCRLQLTKHPYAVRIFSTLYLYFLKFELLTWLFLEEYRQSPAVLANHMTLTYQILHYTPCLTV